MAQFFWTQKKNFGPKPRFDHAMIFDVEKKSTFLFGGSSSELVLLNDTWEWDGMYWIQASDIGPQPRSKHAMAYQNYPRRIIMFGGGNGNVFCGDTWEWNNAFWTQVSNTGPCSRIEHAMSFDGNRNSIILFGGETNDSQLLGDTWEWNGLEWVQLTDMGPSNRKGHVMVFDNKNKCVILFGGQDEEKILCDTWKWDGSKWIEIASFGPAACTQAAIVDAGNSVILFGGYDVSNEVFGNTWQWNGAGWSQTHDMGPAARNGHSMIYDSYRSSLVLFGGITGKLEMGAHDSRIILGDTWELKHDETKGTSEIKVSTIATFEGYYVFSMAIGQDDNIYVTMSGDVAAGIIGNRVVKIKLSNFTTIVKIESREIEPHGIAIDSENTIYISMPFTTWEPLPEQETNVIKRITSSGNISSFAGSGEQGAKDGNGSEAQFNNPMILVTDKANNIYVIENENSIRKITSSAEVSTLDGLQSGVIAFDANNDMYISNESQILKVANSGEIIPVVGDKTPGFADGPSSVAQFNNPTGIAFNLNGDMYIADTGNNRIRKRDKSGEVTTVAGTGEAGFADGPSDIVKFNSPTEIICDSKGNVYVLDKGNKCIRKIEFDRSA